LEVPDAWLRVFVREQPRAGLREEVQELLPRALEIRIDPELVPAPGSGARAAQRAGRSPRQLFADYLDSRGHTDDGVRELFDELFEEVEH
jgi:exonuclease SbcD